MNCFSVLTLLTVVFENRMKNKRLPVCMFILFPFFFLPHYIMHIMIFTSIWVPSSLSPQYLAWICESYETPFSGFHTGHLLMTHFFVQKTFKMDPVGSSK